MAVLNNYESTSTSQSSDLYEDSDSWSSSSVSQLYLDDRGESTSDAYRNNYSAPATLRGHHGNPFPALHKPVQPTPKTHGWTDSSEFMPAILHGHPGNSSSSSYKALKPTPKALGWTEVSDIISMYKFRCGKPNEEPCFELLPQWTVTSQTPSRVYLDPPSNPERGVYPCQFPSSCNRIFSRPADLDRHYCNFHVPMEEKKMFACDYSRCGRATDLFGRKDHYRDHLRDYHKEDIGVAKNNKKISQDEYKKLQKHWLSERKIISSWWRCSKCLVRVNVDGKETWNCPKCSTPCEPHRMESRFMESRLNPSGIAPSCDSCSGTGYVVDDDGGMQVWTKCPLCNVSEPSAYYSTPYEEVYSDLEGPYSNYFSGHLG